MTIARYDASDGSSLGSLTNAFNLADMTLDPSGLHVMVIDNTNEAIQQYNASTGAYGSAWLPGAAGNFWFWAGQGATGLDFGPDGNVYFTATSSHTIGRINAITKVRDEFITFNPGNAWDVAFGPDGDLYVSNDTSVVVRVQGPGNTNPGDSLGSFAVAGTNIRGITFGADRNLYTADEQSGVSSQGSIRTSGAHLGTLSVNSGNRWLTFVPEPATLGLLLASGLALARRRG